MSVAFKRKNPIDKERNMADRDMSGSLSKNTAKPSHADCTGSIVIEAANTGSMAGVRTARRASSSACQLAP
jgi:hypothetical protein